MGQQYAFGHAHVLRHVCMLLFLLPFVMGCEEDKEPSVYSPTLTTNSVTGLSRFGATFQGTVTKHPDSTGDLAIGFLYSTSTSLSNAQEVNATPVDGNNYTAAVVGLTPGEKYYYCIFARSGKSVVKGKTSSFNTEDAIPPSLSIAEATEVTESGATLTATILDNGGYEPTVRGFAYAMYVENAGDPTLDDNTKLVIGDKFEITLSDLAANTTYIVRPYATNDAGTGYGESVKFTTSQQKIPMVIANGSGSLANKPVEVVAYEAVCMGAVTEDHGFTVTEYGFCYSTESRQPTIESSQHIKAQDGAKGFSATLKGLTASTKYYMRAYAKSEKGVGYSATVEFTTDKEQVVSLTQATVTDRTSSSVTITAQMAYESFSTIKEKGICYGQTANPSVDGTKISDSNTEHKVTATITGLKEGDTYHARAYAITRDGTFYSGDIAFTTETTYAPSVSKPSVYDKTETGAKVRASIRTNGGLEVTAKGICYSSTNAKPTLEDLVAISTEADNSILVSLSDLQGGVTYYVRSYATNTKGTGYSEEVEQFTTTKHTEPTLNGLNVMNIKDDNAEASASIANIGGEGETIEERGFVVSTSGDPTIDGYNTTKFVSSSTEDAFSTKLTGLRYNTLYYIRAYAINKVGAGYSKTLSFETGSSERATLGELKCTKTEAHSLSFSFEVTSTGGAELTSQGFMWRKSGESEYTNVSGKLTGNTVTGTITGLTENTGYYVYGYVENKNGETSTGYNTFNTAKLPPGEGDNPTPGDDDGTKKPTVGYTNVSEIYATTAWLSANIESDGKLTITEKGFLWMVDDGTELTIENGTKIIVTSGSTSMRHKLTGLTGKTRYRVRAYAINAKGISYGGYSTFTTEDADKPNPGEGDNPTPGPNTRSNK
ncbi:hypothetical protein DXA68_15610 [Bacteroides stercorirosoris]|uniref:Fibronectin type-III domain-containing protein n=2 Tax=Bacteroides stercorirosoris TaxID=871324 RepID=A0A413H1R8_9BACE|nr:hypothetical protein DXA68_15610 [Bacteroides stercorirosoris]